MTDLHVTGGGQYKLRGQRTVSEVLYLLPLPSRLRSGRTIRWRAGQATEGRSSG